MSYLIDLTSYLKEKSLMICCAESCTGGLLASKLTDQAGSSSWFERGFVTYSNHSKQELLNVPAELIETVGAVSEPVAKAMALGALQNSHADISVSITGIAGPDGGTADKPVGTVWFGVCVRGHKPTAYLVQFGMHERARIREMACQFALETCLKTAVAAHG